MSKNKKKLIISNLTVKLGCGSCRRSKLLFSNIFHHIKPKLHINKTTTSNYSSSATSFKTTTTTFSPAYVYSDEDDDTDSDIKRLRTFQGFGRISNESLAVEKESDDPYLDFRHTMLQMILENHIYSQHDLKELLNCFLHLNSPYYHAIIIRVFTEIWDGVYSVKSASISSIMHGHGLYK